MKRVTFVTDHSVSGGRHGRTRRRIVRGPFAPFASSRFIRSRFHRESAKYAKRLEKARLARIATSPFLSPEKRKRAAALWDSAHCRPLSRPITYKAVERMSAT